MLQGAADLLITGWILFGILTLALIPSVISASLKTLRRQSRPYADPETWPKVSVILVARNEQAQIEQALQSLIHTDYPQLELIAVDDRSTDSTGELMDAAASRCDHLKVIHLTELPEDWLGKNHAMHRGAESASGDLLLFTDGDVLYHSETLRESVRYLTGRRLDHLCLVPRLIPGGMLENSACILFGLILTAGCPPWLIPSSVSFIYIGIGAFNLVSREAYQRVGGHTPIRFDVLDDVKLGKLFKRYRLKQDVLTADDRLRVRWQDSFRGVIRGLEKNSFAATNYSIGQLILVTFVLLGLLVAPTVVALSGLSAAAGGFVASAVLAHLVYGWFSWRNGCGWYLMPLLTFAVMTLVYTAWRSAYVTLRRGGVLWRDTFYSLKDLRSRIYR